MANITFQRLEKAGLLPIAVFGVLVVGVPWIDVIEAILTFRALLRL